MFRNSLLSFSFTVVAMANYANESLPKGPLKVAQEIQVKKDGKICVKLEISNPSDKTVFLEKIGNAPAPMRQEFEILFGSDSIEYIGPMAKRRAFVKEDFFPLLPGGKYSRTVEIQNLYEFPRGKHRFNSRYYYTCFDVSVGKPATYSSDQVEFEYKKGR